jgi:hypothetical protein
MDAGIESARHWFQKIYLGGVPQLIRDDTAFLAFVCILTGVEALAGYRYEARGAGRRFQEFVQGYFPAEYRPLTDDLWRLRNGMIHGFTPRQFALMHNSGHAHLKRTDGGVLILNAEDFYAAFVMASSRFFRELEGSPQGMKLVG